MVGARELLVGTGRVVAALLVREVATVVLVVALPGVEDAAAVAATELVGLARVVGCGEHLFLFFLDSSETFPKVKSPKIKKYHKCQQ